MIPTLAAVGYPPVLASIRQLCYGNKLPSLSDSKNKSLFLIEGPVQAGQACLYAAPWRCKTPPSCDSVIFLPAKSPGQENRDMEMANWLLTALV